MNIALAVAMGCGGLERFESRCMELVDEVLHRHPDADILWVDLEMPDDPLSFFDWMYHAVPVINGLVHDAWHPEAMLPPPEYVDEVWSDRNPEWGLMSDQQNAQELEMSDLPTYPNPGEIWHVRTHLGNGPARRLVLQVYPAQPREKTPKIMKEPRVVWGNLTYGFCKTHTCTLGTWMKSAIDDFFVLEDTVDDAWDHFRKATK